MHYTLTPRGNVMLMALMATVLAVCIFTGSGPSLLVLAGFAVGGVIAGLLQNNALRRHTRQFQTASSALQVRVVLISSVPGKGAVALLWLAGVTLLLLLIYGGQYATIQTVVGSYAVFSLAREAASFPALFALRSSRRAQ